MKGLHDNHFLMFFYLLRLPVLLSTHLLEINIFSGKLSTLSMSEIFKTKNCLNYWEKSLP